MKLSIVSPVYRAEATLEELVQRITYAVLNFTNDFEIVLVDDRSPDASWEKICAISKSNSRVKGIRLSKNFGQHYAITAALDHATGDWVVVMDCDLQDIPEEIPNLYQKAITGYDVVLARRHDRQDHFFKRFTSLIFYKVLSYLAGFKQDETVANFGIYSGKVIGTIKSMRESIRYFPTMVRWAGFKQTSINVMHGRREEGRSNYNFKKLLNLALDIILAHSDKPLRSAIKLGVLVAGVSFFCGIYVTYQWLIGEIVVMGYTSLILSIWFLSGVIITILGTVGLYVGKTFEGIKNRPIYIIDEIV